MGVVGRKEVVSMRRIISVLAVVALMAALLVTSALPAFADKGGFDHAGACGLGKAAAHRAILNTVAPGASETALIPPANTGCTGNP